MLRKDIALLDWISVISNDGTWSLESLELEPRKEQELDRFGFELARREGYKNAELLFPLYKNGELKKAGYAEIKMHCSDTEDVRVLELVLRASDLPDEIWEQISPRIPKDPCVYSGCVSCVDPIMTAYRDTDGCVGRSWETPILQGFDSDSAHQIYQVYKTEGAYAAGVKAWEMVHEWNQRNLVTN